MSVIVPLRAQLPDYHVQVFNDKNGLHTALMYKVVKDKNGFVWILYRDSRIQRFDGKKVTEFTVPDQWMLALICDDINGIWAASRTNIFHFKNDHEGFKRVEYDTTGNTTLGEFLKVPGMEMVIHANNGFYVFDRQANKMQKITHGVLSLKNTINYRSADSYENTVFVLAKDSVHAINISSGVIRTLPSIGSLISINALNEDSALVSVWGYQSAWYDFKKGTVTIIDIGREFGERSSTFFRVNKFAQVNEQEFILLTLNGILLYNSTTARFKKLNSVSLAWQDTYFHKLTKIQLL